MSGNSSLGDGGGIYINNADLSLTNSTVSGNTSGGSGGGILADSGAASYVTLVNSTVNGTPVVILAVESILHLAIFH